MVARSQVGDDDDDDGGGGDAEHETFKGTYAVFCM